MATVRFSFPSSVQCCGYNAAAGGRGGTVARQHSYHIPTGNSAHTHTTYSNMARTNCLTLNSGGAFLKKESGVQSKAQDSVQGHPYYSRHLKVSLSWCKVTWTSIYHDARSHERQFITMHGHLNFNLWRCTVIWTSIYHDARSPKCQFIMILGQLNVNLSRCN